MDVHWCVDVFSSLNQHHVWWNFTTVRVEAIWKDIKENRLILMLLDKNRDKMIATIPHHLMESYSNVNLVGGVFALDHFQVEQMYMDSLAYQKYNFVHDDWVIRINKNTTFTPLTHGFASYPLVPSIKTVVEDKSKRKILIDIVGKIIEGRRARNKHLVRFGSTAVFLQDATMMYKLKVILWDTSRFEPVKIALAIKEKSIMYASRLKLIRTKSMNVLSSTDLTKIEIEPTMPEADNIRLMRS